MRAETHRTRDLSVVLETHQLYSRLISCTRMISTLPWELKCVNVCVCVFACGGVGVWGCWCGRVGVGGCGGVGAKACGCVRVFVRSCVRVFLRLCVRVFVCDLFGLCLLVCVFACLLACSLASRLVCVFVCLFVSLFFFARACESATNYAGAASELS